MKVAEHLAILFYPMKKEQSADGLMPIYCRITVEGARKVFSTGIKVDPNTWNKETYRANGATKKTFSINNQLTHIQAELEKHYLILTTQYQYVTVDLLKRAYKREPSPEEKEKARERTICQVFNYKFSIFAKQVKKNLRSPGTLNKWKTTKVKLRRFLKHKFDRWDMPLSALKYKHAEDFMNYLTLTETMVENTARKYVKNVKGLLEIAEAREWIAKNPWAKYQIGYDQPDRQCLTMLEVIAIYNHEFIDRLDYIRDIFLFACFTGYAFGELSRFTKNDIFIGSDGKRWIAIDRKKTGKPEYIPLLPIPASIVDKYSNDPYCVRTGRLLPLRSLTHYNGYLKEIADIVGIQFELSSHVARHTFATTICLDNDVPLETVQRLLGHASIRTTQIYAKITKKKISRNMTELEAKLFSFDGKLIDQMAEIVLMRNLQLQKTAS